MCFSYILSCEISYRHPLKAFLFLRYLHTNSMVKTCSDRPIVRNRSLNFKIKCTEHKWSTGYLALERRGKQSKATQNRHRINRFSIRMGIIKETLILIGRQFRMLYVAIYCWIFDLKSLVHFTWPLGHPIAIGPLINCSTVLSLINFIVKFPYHWISLCDTIIIRNTAIFDLTNILPNKSLFIGIQRYSLICILWLLFTAVNQFVDEVAKSTKGVQPNVCPAMEKTKDMSSASYFDSK